jgi:hypothetical protein
MQAWNIKVDTTTKGIAIPPDGLKILTLAAKPGQS